MSYIETPPTIIGYLVEGMMAFEPRSHCTGFCLDCWELAQQGDWHFSSEQVHAVMETSIQQIDLLCSFCQQSMREKFKQHTEQEG